MKNNVFILDERHQWFIDQGRIDPMTREMFSIGDHVVVCNKCKTVFKKTTWDDCGKCTAPGCSCQITDKHFLTMSSNGNKNLFQRGGGNQSDKSNGNKPQMIIKRINRY